MSRTAFFTVKYDGPARETHEMDVKELSPALFALGEALEESNRILNGSRTKVVLNVKALKDGSLGIDFNLVQDFASQALDLFNNKDVTGALNLIQVVIYECAGTYGLVRFIKWVAGRPIKSLTKLESGNVKVILEDEDSIEIDSKTAKLYPVVKIRKSIETVVYNPLQKSGVDKIEFLRDDQYESVGRDEAAYFITPELDEEPIDEQEYTTSLQIINAAFQENNKWKFSDGATSFWAEVRDTAFLKRVHTNTEAFAKDDILRVKILKKQFEVPNGLRTDFFVEEVLEHKSALSTYHLPFTEEKENPDS